MGLWKLNFERTRIENYLRSRNYENWIIKIGDLGNHSKVEFLEIMNKIIIIMTIISNGINARIGNWKLSSEIRELGFQMTKFGNRNFEELFKDGILNKWISE